MKHLDIELTTEKKAAIRAAAKETQFSTQSLLEELIPIIKDCFIAEAIIDGNVINLSFLNGQKFRISAEEV